LLDVIFGGRSPASDRRVLARGEYIVDHAVESRLVAVPTLTDFVRFAKRCPVEWNMPTPPG
jgi:hypothetical protein